MVMIALINAARASNIFNITLNHVNLATEDQEFKGAMIFRSPKYKTSMLYGTKLLLVPNDLYNFLKKYIDFCRPIILGEANEDAVKEKSIFIK